MIQQRKKILILSVLALLVFAIGGSFIYNSSLFKDPIYIGLVGPITGKGSGYGLSMVQAMDMLVEETNKAGGIDGHKVELVIKDDQNNKELAKERAEEFARQDIVSIIIGHYYSSANLNAQDVYKKYKIPTITPSATNVNVTTQSPWMFRTTFNDDFQGKFLAHYAQDVLKAKNIVVIYDADAFGSGLRRSFIEAAMAIGLHEMESLTFDNKQPDYSFVDNLAALNADLIFLATHAPEAAELVPLIRNTGVKAEILGPDALGSQAFVSSVGPSGEGVYATMPLLFDIAGEKAQVFRGHYKDKYRSEPDWQAAFTYDAGLMAIKAIREAGTDRTEIREKLASFNSLNSSVPGVTGNNYFNEYGGMVKPPAISKLTNGKFVSTLMQVQMPDIELSDTELDRYKRNGQLLIVEGTPFLKTNVVFTGIDIIDMPFFNEKEQTYTFDFYLWMRWNGDLDPTNYEFINGSLDDPPLVIREKHDNNSHYIVQRLRGTFKSEFQFQGYPFDYQVLRITLRHKMASRRILIYVPDNLSLSNNIPKLTTSTWIPQSSWQYSGVQLTESTLGDIRNASAPQVQARATYNYAISIKRVVLPIVLKMLIPLLLIVVVCFVQLFLAPSETEARVGVGVTTFLSAIAFHISQSNNLPSVGYMITAEKFFYASYAIIVMVILVTTIVHYNFSKGREDVALQWDRVSRIVLPLLFCFSLALIVVLK
jgi:branched-chain amino acid transport system substrate-binding protein